MTAIARAEQIPALGAGRVLTAVDRSARETPDDLAVSAPDGTLTFARLAVAVPATAAALIGAGVGPGTVIGLAHGRSVRTVPALLAVWHVGATAVPVDDRHPAERIAFQLRDAGVTVVSGALPSAALPAGVARLELPLTSTDDLDSAPIVPVAVPAADDRAYLIYTSGTTGRPKGVEVGYGALGAFLEAVSGMGLSSGGLGFNPLSPAFDGWLWCTLLYLLHGQGVAIVDTASATGALDLSEAIAAVGPRTVCLSPSLLAACPDDMPTVEIMVVAGEPCPPALVDRFGGRHRMLNVYGPTEATIAATWADSAAGDDVCTIGRAMRGYTTHVLDADREPAAPGTDGELYIGGPGVALSYRNRPGLTSARFVPDPFAGPGARMYRTGDLVRARTDGQLEFVGRLDDQVKIRAYRIELGEIERTAASTPGVRSAVAYVLRSGDAVGLAVVPAADTEADECGEQALELCRQRLPEVMVPVLVQTMAVLPITASGKADRRALAEQAADMPAPCPVGATRPRTDRERQVCAVWSDVLPQPIDDVEIDFFAAGGHSLLASRAVVALRKVTGLRVSVRDLLAHPTPGALARELDRIAEAAGS